MFRKGLAGASIFLIAAEAKIRVVSWDQEPAGYAWAVDDVVSQTSLRQYRQIAVCSWKRDVQKFWKFESRAWNNGSG